MELSPTTFDFWGVIYEKPGAGPSKWVGEVVRAETGQLQKKKDARPG
jgi:hypothetical protein